MSSDDVEMRGEEEEAEVVNRVKLVKRKSSRGKAASSAPAPAPAKHKEKEEDDVIWQDSG